MSALLGSLGEYRPEKHVKKIQKMHASGCTRNREHTLPDAPLFAASLPVCDAIALRRLSPIGDPSSAISCSAHFAEYEIMPTAALARAQRKQRNHKRNKCESVLQLRMQSAGHLTTVHFHVHDKGQRAAAAVHKRPWLPWLVQAPPPSTHHCSWSRRTGSSSPTRGQCLLQLPMQAPLFMMTIFMH